MEEYTIASPEITYRPLLNQCKIPKGMISVFERANEYQDSMEFPKHLSTKIPPDYFPDCMFKTGQV